MAGMLDKMFDEKAEKIKSDFEIMLFEHDKMLKAHLDRIEKKMDEMAAKVK